MSETSVTLYFDDALGRRQHAKARLIDGHTWQVFSDVSGRTFSRECWSWQGVERMLTWLRRHGHEPERASSRPQLAAVLVAVTFLMGAIPLAAQPVSVSDAEQQFVAATQEYAWMHRRLEEAIGPIEINSNVARIDRAVLALAAAIRAERPNAKTGDFFTPRLAGELRARIFDALTVHDLAPGDVREAEAADGVDPSLVTLWVNGPFPWAYSSAMFPCVLEALPPLPAELQYRIVGDTLVLIDVHASLVVDLLPSALTPTTER
ncbi:MAG TPA: hypothetical protein VFV51_13210 [Vicinamibacterales bacterium]|nr:hypothetical protein [Vicinamibacterales bacterium]